MTDITFVRGKFGKGLKKVVAGLREHGWIVDVIKHGEAYQKDVCIDVLINWGVAQYDYLYSYELILNDPNSIDVIKDKLQFYKNYCHLVNFVPTTDHKWMAQAWLDMGETIMCRSLTQAHGGKGITVIQPGEELPDSKYYTLYKKGTEYRVHFAGGRIIDVAQKKKMSSKKLEEKGYVFNPFIRSHKNGWVHAHNNIKTLSPITLLQIQQHLSLIKLDFFAADLIYCEDEGRFHLLEVNTAPGLTQSVTIKAYVEYFRRVSEEFGNE